MRLRVALVTFLIFVAAVGRSPAADLSAIFNSAGLKLNDVVAGNIVESRAKLSAAALTQALGPPSRTDVDGRTQRITWDDEGIQLEAIAQESVPFAVLFEFTNVDSTNQGLIPNQPYRGTLDCLGIKLDAGQHIADQETFLSAAGFKKDSASASGEVWSLHLEHWAVFLRFSASGAIDSAVIRVLPDIY
ncbi:MAG: hypothetical protein JOZ31_03515 [Verrucomicrobia bacterium]|nr:hypothetical protein [Verrucomicrobiota bacterium]MBV8482254.1 hypothetical protein [Verrucomicrobiota bacterium]